MLFVSKKFKDDTLGSNTKLVPLIIFELPKYSWEENADDPDKWLCVSTGRTEAKHRIYRWYPVGVNPEEGGAAQEGSWTLQEHNLKFIPLLLGMPRLKESIDVRSGKFKISNVSLKLSNVEYMGERLSDIFERSVRLNTTVSIHFQSQGANYVIGSYFANLIKNDSQNTYTEFVDRAYTDITDEVCPIIYTGKIRSLSHTDEVINIKLEDLTEKKIHKQLPSQSLGDDEIIEDLYKNKPIPMLYGKLSHAPTVRAWSEGELKCFTDYREIYALYDSNFFLEDTNHHGEVFSNMRQGGIYFYENHWISVMMNVWSFFEKNQFNDEEQMELFYKVLLSIAEENGIKIEDGDIDYILGSDY